MKIKFRNFFWGLSSLFITNFLVGSDRASKLSQDEIVKKITHEMGDLEKLFEKISPTLTVLHKEKANEEKEVTYWKYELNQCIHLHIRAIAGLVQRAQNDEDLRAIDFSIKTVLRNWADKPWYQEESSTIFQEMYTKITDSLADAVVVRDERNYCVLPDPLPIRRVSTASGMWSVFPKGGDSYEGGEHAATDTSNRRKISFTEPKKSYDEKSKKVRAALPECSTTCAERYFNILLRLKNTNDFSRGLLKTKRPILSRAIDKNKAAQAARNALKRNKEILWGTYSSNENFLSALWQKFNALDQKSPDILKEMSKVQGRYHEVTLSGDLEKGSRFIDELLNLYSECASDCSDTKALVLAKIDLVKKWDKLPLLDQILQEELADIASTERLLKKL